ncbi:MAG: DsbA family protein [Gammaproteobacteria bacterium]
MFGKSCTTAWVGALLAFTLAMAPGLPVIAAPAAAPPPAVKTERIVPAQPSGAAPDQIGVLVFFDFSPASHALINYLEGWSGRAGQQVVLDREPLVANTPDPLVRAFIVARTLGVVEPVLPGLFKLAADTPAQPLTVQTLEKAFEPWGIDPIEFGAAWQSPVATDGVIRARALAARYGVSSAPVIVVNGVWRLTPTAGANPQDLIAALDARIAAASTSEAENQ